MEVLRTFIAIPFSSAVRAHLAECQAGLRAAVPAAVKWVETENLHLTVRFLGDTPEGDLPAICAALKTAVTALPSFPIVVSGLGAFPSRQAPCVVWAGVAEGRAALQALHQRVESALAAAGFTAAPERFSPHITLGRARGGQPAPGLAPLLTADGCAPISDQVTRLVFLRSLLTGRHPVYLPLAEYELTGGKTGREDG